MIRLALAALALALAGCDRLASARPAEVEGLRLTGRVVDAANILDPATEKSLTETASALEKKTSDQLVIVTTTDLGGQSIEQFGKALGTGWGIGQKKLDNGVILLVAPARKQVRIAVGKGLEGLLTDSEAARIVADMLPDFRGGHDDEAVTTGAGEIADLLERDTARPRYLDRRKAA